MPTSEIVEKYSVSQKEAYEKIKNIFTEATKKHGGKISNLNQKWDEKKFFGEANFDVHLNIMGIPVSGKLSGKVWVYQNPKEVKMSVDYPLAAASFKETVEKMLRNGARQLLDQ